MTCKSLGAALGAALLFAGPGFLVVPPRITATMAGESACGPHDALVAGLAERFGEAIVFRGRHPSASQVMEVLVNPETGTFTVLITNPTASCVMAAGVAGELVEFVKPPVGQPG